MFVEYSREDVSFLRLLDEDGTFVGVLRAPHPWYLQPHSLKVRSELWKATKQGQFQFARNETPTEAFRRLKLATGDTSRRVATTLYKETGRVSEDPSSVKGRDGDTPERLNHQRVKLTKVFTL
jgi:hypothetical protein